MTRAVLWTAVVVLAVGVLAVSTVRSFTTDAECPAESLAAAEAANC